MRRFADLHLIPPLQDADAIERMAELATEMGFSLVGLTFDSNSPTRTKLESIQAFKQRGIDTVSRVDLHSKHRNELLESLRKVRPSFDLVAVECSTKQVTTTAFRDRRVDILFFRLDYLRITQSLLTPRNLGKVFEFNVADILGDDTASLRRASGLLSYIKNGKLPMIISSGAVNWHLMRAPRDMAAVASMIGIDLDQAINAVSRSPFCLASRSLRRRDPSYISEGVRIVRSRI